VGLIGSGVVIHVPSFFNELDALEQKGRVHPGLTCFSDDRCAGLNCSGRIFISDRAHLVFDFHQIVDGLKEVELGGSRYDSSLSS
jgi:adenylosuccinate synthase